MMPLHYLATLLRHGARNIRYGGWHFALATLMTALGLFALAAYLTFFNSIERFADEAGQDIGVVAFLSVTDPADAEEVRTRIARMDGIAQATLISPEEATKRVRQSLGKSADALGNIVDDPSLQMPYTIEVAISGVGSGKNIPRAQIADRIDDVVGIEQVMHPGGELERLESVMQLLAGAGWFLAMLIALVVTVIVNNTIRLTVFARRDEIVLYKLVGATDWFVRIPFLIEGVLQGLLASTTALLSLAAVQSTAARIAQTALADSLGDFSITPLSLSSSLFIIAMGIFLGLFGAAFAVGRFLRV